MIRFWESNVVLLDLLSQLNQNSKKFVKETK